MTTTETGKVTAVRTFTVSVTAAFATVPSAIVLAKGDTNPVGGVTNVQIPLPGATDTHGAVTGWVVKYGQQDQAHSHRRKPGRLDYHRQQRGIRQRV